MLLCDDTMPLQPCNLPFSCRLVKGESQSFFGKKGKMAARSASVPYHSDCYRPRTWMVLPSNTTSLEMCLEPNKHRIHAGIDVRRNKTRIVWHTRLGNTTTSRRRPAWIGIRASSMYLEATSLFALLKPAVGDEFRRRKLETRTCRQRHEHASVGRGIPTRRYRVAKSISRHHANLLI